MPFRLFGRRAPAAPEIKDSAARRLVAFAHLGRPQWTPRDYAGLAREGFTRNAVVYRCVRMLAEAAASVPLVVHHEGREAPDHPLRRLIERPNPDQAGPDLREALFCHLQIAGNAYLEAAGEPGEAPTELYVLRPDRVKVIPGPQGWPAAWEYAVGSRAVRLAREADGWAPVLHMKLHHPLDDWYGFPPVEAAAFSIDVHNASGAWNKAMLDNAARPSGALVYGSRDGRMLTPEQFDRLKTGILEQYTGLENAGRPLLLEGGLEWKPLSLSPADMDFVEGKHAAAREIALAFGVPPPLLGIPGDNTYANYKEANAAFWRAAVIPLVEKACRSMDAWLEPRFPGAHLCPDLDRTPALAAEREALWARLEAASFLTQAERRRLAGLADCPEDLS